jgi:hypothetical protein
LDDIVILAPSSDRVDFMRYGRDTASRVRVWKQAVAESVRLRDELAALVHSQALDEIVEPL